MMPAAMLESVFWSASATARPIAPRIAMIEVLGTPIKLAAVMIAKITMP